MKESLMEFQRFWLAALRDPESVRDATPLACLNGGVRSGAQGFAIYVNNIRATLIEAMSLSYPMTLALVGRPTFCRAVVHGLQHFPPRHGDLGEYGGDFYRSVSAVMSGTEQQHKAQSVSAVTRCEWSMDCVRRAPRERPLTEADLQSLPATQWLELRLPLATHASVLVADDSLYESLLTAQKITERNVVNFLLHNRSTSESEINHVEPLFNTGGLLIVAKNEQLHLYPLSPAEHTCVLALNSGSTLAQAIDVVLQSGSELDLTTLLLRLLEAQALPSRHETHVNWRNEE